MEVYSTFQREFMQTLSCVQEVCVQTALCQQEGTLEEQFYNITAEVIIGIMEMIDGYANPSIGKLNVICPKNGESLKNPPMELHDVVCKYLKGLN